jgi:hypothetical protein
MRPVIEHDQIRFGKRFAVSFHRTLRIPDDGRTYPLPPGLGRLPILPTAAYARRAPASWRGRAGAFIPLYQREALWLGFDTADWKPTAVKVGIGDIDTTTGEAWTDQLQADPQDYVVCPPQLWLDGINAGHGYVRQFVAMPLGLGFTVESQLTGTEAVGGIQILVFDPRPGRFPDRPPRRRVDSVMYAAMAQPTGEMGLATGGRIEQKIYPDPYGIDTWEPRPIAKAHVHLLNSAQYQAITGRETPPTPIDAATYTAHGFPWFALYDETQGDIAPTPRLERVKSVAEQEDDELRLAAPRIISRGDPARGAA